MKTVSVRQTLRLALASLLVISGVLAATPAHAVTPQARIVSAIDATRRTELPGTLPPRARHADDIGNVPANTPLSAITLVFSRTPAQQAALDALIAAQQDPTSPSFHQFLTPEQFGAQFGAAPADIAATEAWLQQQGFSLQGVSRSSDRIFFSGTVAQVASAFGAELHYFSAADGTRFAPSTALTIPSAIASSVLTITNLSNFRPHSHVKLRPAGTTTVPDPAFTSGQTGSIFLDPKDLATIYDVNAAYSAGYTGIGQAIAVIGQTGIVTTDLTHFQTALGITARQPTQILVPGTGGNAIFSGDEAESDIDLEYSSAMAPGATVYFVYTGNTGNTNGVFTALAYAITNNIAPIVTLSYGECEPDLASGEYAQVNAVLQQGAAQGQSIFLSAGDSGSTGCYVDTADPTATRQAVAADFPASSQYVTAMGGTGIAAANESSTYFNTTSGTDVISSAKSYVPEVVWNDDAYAVSKGATGANVVDATGGGISILTPRPTWQAGVPGIPTGSFRLLPDVSLLGSNYFPGLLYCSSDSETNINGSCSNGFRDSSNVSLTVAGGTSFDAPIFAGLIALINQAKGYTAGQGLINPTLYTLASNAATYATAFHDITTGSNACLSGTTYCAGTATTLYPAGTGYDEASGLGSVDFYNLLTAWPAAVTTGLAATTTTITPANSSPAVNATDVLTITVATASTTVTSTPQGTVSIYVNGTLVASNLPLTNGTTTYTYTGTTAGSVLIKAVYSGSPIYNTSSGLTTLNVGSTSVSLTASNVTVAQGSTGTSTLLLTPMNGYTGTFQFLTIYAPPNLTNACVTAPANITILGILAGSSTLTIYTNNAACPGNSVALVAGIAAAGLLLIGFFGRRSKHLRSVVIVALLAVAGLGLSGCSNSATTAYPISATSAAKGTYVLTIAGADTVNSATTASASFTLTIN
jgi:subtilase family serine protease